jgi:ribonuclease Z
MQPQLAFFCKDMKYPIFFHSIDATRHAVIFEDNTITVESLPLKHRIPCCGFLFKEKPKKRHLLGDAVAFYNIPTYKRQEIKNGADYITPEGKTIPNSRLTREADPSRSYAYCSDTRFNINNTQYIKDVDLLFHEATFADSEAARAAQTYHSTAHQAAEMALRSGAKRLLIGHFSARYTDERLLLNEAREVFPATELAEEGKVFKL